MKNNVQINVKKIIFSLLILLFTAMSVCFFASINFALADASTTIKAQSAYPIEGIELSDLSTNPKSVYHDDNLTAIVDGSFKNLYIYTSDGVKTIDVIEKIEDVKRRDDKTLYYSDNTRLYKYDLESKTSAPVADFSVSVSYFDFNSEFIIVASQEVCNLYKLDGSFTKITSSHIPIKDGTHVAINDKNEIFLVLNDGIYKTSTTSPAPTNNQKISDETPSEIIANDNTIYFIKQGKIYKMPTSGGVAVELKTKGNEEFDLGKINQSNLPTNLSFNGDNLIVVINETVQEFRIVDDQLEFTGFAIAKNKTAYNRISSSAVEIEKYGDKIAVLDGNKLSVIKTDSDNKYNLNNYQNYLRDKENTNDLTLLNNNIEYFALGENKIIFSIKVSNDVSSLAVLNLTKPLTNKDGGKENLSVKDITPDFFLTTNHKVYDICYQSGYFYILLHTTGSSQVYKISENSDEFTFTKIFATITNKDLNILTVDVFGSLYLADATSVYKGEIDLDKAESLSSQLSTLAQSTSLVKKLATDLGGNLFVLTDSGLNLVKDNALSPIEIEHINSGDKISSFALNFDKKEVYFTYQDREYIAYSDKLSNLSITDAIPTEDYIISNTTTEFANLKAYKIKEDVSVNIYSVIKEQNAFNYKGLTTKESEYIKICDLTVDNIGLTALAGQKGVVLVNSNQIEQINLASSNCPEKVYTTTNVNMYYFPLITKAQEYSLNNNGVIRLEKQALVSVEEKITFLDNDFYFVSITINNEQVKGYIPVSFTVEVLTQDFVWDNYALEEVANTTLYKNADLTEEIDIIENGTKVRVMNNENGVCFVIIDLGDNNFIEGYISSSALKTDEPNTTVRNILIILAVTASVCGTLTYFLLRKKD